MDRQEQRFHYVDSEDDDENEREIKKVSGARFA